MDIGRYERMEEVVIDNSIPVATHATQPDQPRVAPEEVHVAPMTSARAADIATVGVA